MEAVRGWVWIFPGIAQFSLRRPHNSIYDVLMASTLFFVINELRKRVMYAHTY